MSLRWRILGAFVLIILLTILVSAAVEYWSQGTILDRYAGKIRETDLASSLGRLYAQSGTWESLDAWLVRLGYQLDAETLAKLEAEGVDAAEKRPFGVIVRDPAGNVIIDAAYSGEAASGTTISRLESDPTVILHPVTGQSLGTVTLYVDRAYAAAEARLFLWDALRPTAIAGLIAAGVAVTLAIWLSRRITAPVTALTVATRSIAQGERGELLPVTLTDEMGQMSASFNQMVTDLRTQEALRKRLVDDLAHELNTSLSLILLEAKGVLDGMQSPADGAQHIIDEVKTLQSLVHDLNLLAEADAGTLRLKREPRCVAALLRAEVSRWQPHAQAARIKLELRPLAADLPTLDLDPTRISQALANLIDNALQHTPPGGSVQVSARRAEDAVEFAVADTGHGIAKEDLHHVFERFYRADRSRQRGTGGRGLGLSIVQQIVRGHGGRVWAESEPGSGSCFHFCLPV